MYSLIQFIYITLNWSSDCIERAFQYKLQIAIIRRRRIAQTVLKIVILKSNADHIFNAKLPCASLTLWCHLSRLLFCAINVTIFLGLGGQLVEPGTLGKKLRFCGI
jgi:hypothetical protein